MKEYAYVLKGAKCILVPKSGLVHAIGFLKNFGAVCLGAGGLFMLSEHIKGANRDAYKDLTEEAGSIGNLIKNSLDRD